jgi:hypothetical protein
MANETAFPGPYVDQSITRRNVVNDAVADPGPAKAGNRTTPTKVYETEGTNHSPNNGVVAKKPTTGNNWSRKPYENGGMLDQDDYLANSN